MWKLDDSDPVQVLRDYPYSRLSDEGRAMVQIVHDIAPKRTLLSEPIYQCR